MPTLSDIACHVVLDTLQRRNGAVEVIGIPPEGDHRDASWYRVRLLEYGHAGLVIERPQAPESNRFVRPDAFVRVRAVEGLERWQFLSRVEKATRFDLNANMQVPALALSLPIEVQSGQRRSFFRVQTAAAGLPPALLTPLPAQPQEQDANGASPLPFKASAAPPVPALALIGGAEPSPTFPPQPFQAAVLNIAGGGIGLEAPQRVAAQIHQVVFYRCRLELPTCQSPLEIGARVQHIAPMENGAHYLGLSFECLNPTEHRQCIDAICRFSAWYQRQQLQRLREKT